MSTYVVIPARKGSKRIPNKNYRVFCGDSMLKRAIKLGHAIDTSPGFPFVSSDENRPEHLCNDTAGLLEVMKYEVGQCLLNDTTIVICLLPCTPLLRPQTLIDALASYKRFYAATHEMLVTVTSYGHPVDRRLWLKHNALSMDFPMENMRTQDCDEYYHDAGAFYIATAKRWCEDKPILEGARPWFLPRWEAVDIDTEADWQLAEYIYKGRQSCE